MCRSASVAPLTPTYHLWSPAGDKPWYLHRGKTAAALHLNLTLGETNEGREAINTEVLGSSHEEGSALQAEEYPSPNWVTVSPRKGGNSPCSSSSGTTPSMGL